MGTPFLSEIKIVSFNFAPRNWAFCNGQFLPIAQNQALFSLLGTVYGGNGQTTFALPNFQGKVPIHVGGGHTLGETAGEVAHTVSMGEMPTHIHFVSGTSNTGTGAFPNGNLLAATANQMYTQVPSGLVAMAPATVSTVGQSQAHANMQPYLVLNFIIALSGVFPSQN